MDVEQLFMLLSTHTSSLSIYSETHPFKNIALVCFLFWRVGLRVVHYGHNYLYIICRYFLPVFGVLYFFLHIQVLVWLHIRSAWWTCFIISFRIDLLAMNSISFYLFEESLFPLVLKVIFTDYRFLVWWFPPSPSIIALKMSVIVFWYTGFW